MKPIVQTQEMETQTEDSTPLTTFACIDTQTESQETADAKIGTDNATMKDGAMQTAATRTDTVEIQTESVTLINSEVQVNTMVAEMQCQTSEIQVSESD